MEAKKILQINGIAVDKNQLKNQLENIATTHNITAKTDKATYPIPRMIENYEVIKTVYKMLNSNLKQEITIHPAGEWLLDNFYIIEETVKTIRKDITQKKYRNFVGIKSGKYEGYARVYVLASEIIAYTDNKINREELEEYLIAYQKAKYLSMEEVWNIGTFLQIAIIENIREICEKIYSSQIQKIRAKNIIEKTLEKRQTEMKENNIIRKEVKKKIKLNEIDNSRYAYIEYMSYSLKKYGKRAYSYQKTLEEIVSRTGITVQEAIKREHIDIAVRKVSIGNGILSLKAIQRMNFSEIFEKVNGIEELLRQDPASVYEKMDYKTKEYYRNQIKEIGYETKISEIYITQKLLELANKCEEGSKKRHIGYYLVDKGIEELYKKLGYRYKDIQKENKMKIYILATIFFSISISVILGLTLNKNNLIYGIIGTILLIIPISEVIIQIMQYILGKIIKPKIIPKMDFTNGIDKENATFVVIPTIVKTKEKIKELAQKLEVFYLANKSENLYFSILGDCSESKKEEEDFDKEVIEVGKQEVEKLNKKYSKTYPKFNFIYRKRQWNKQENSFLGWERKRGYLNQFNKFLLGEEQKNFIVNTIQKENMPEIKYVITLDSDTDLPIDTAAELIGAMAHILNKPVIDEKRNVVIEGYGIMQPRIGVKLDISYKNLFTKIFAGQGGTDLYSNAISDVYQDNFGEGIFTGKGIYDLKVFETVIKGAIPENTVLSHDLLEGCYLRCGLVSDIMLIDDYPSKYMSHINRLSRWIRGDWQIIRWLKSKQLNIISKYKIFDNLRRSLLEIFTIVCMAYFIKSKILVTISLVSIMIPYILEIINYIIFKKEGEKYQKTFIHKVGTMQGAIYRIILTIGALPYKAYMSIVAILKTIYRLAITHKHLLEWTTSEEAEKTSKTDILSYYKIMFANIIFGLLIGVLGVKERNIFEIIIGIIWLITPGIMCYISKAPKENKRINEITNEEEKYIKDVAKRTWDFFEDYLTEENNYLIIDNYQEGRIPQIVQRTSSTNIGLSLLAVISSYDMKFISRNKAIQLLEKIIGTIESLPKWNGHLYNWYNTKTMQSLVPRYVSTVDSGNFVGYLYVTKGFINNLLEKYKNVQLKKIIKNKKKKNKNIKKYKGTNKIKKVDYIEKLKKMKRQLVILIKNTDFSALYSQEQRLFSIGFNVEENKLTDSYYDLLASEARQASLVAIAKKDVPVKHWHNLSRTLTNLNEYKGLISWSGTAFEYLMPNINIPVYKGSLIDESCKFMIMSQREYAKKLGISWGISEAAFNLKDLHSNYQYKAFGIPWLGLKRGLADEMVVSSYGSILAINYEPKEVIKNLKELESQGMLNKYGFYESIDYTPERLGKGETSSVVKTYMAHHQALILLSINNLINDNILQERFMYNPEIAGTQILLQERMPETFIITKETKEKIEKIKYKDYEGYTEQMFNKINEKIISGNVISNTNYTIAINQKGNGFSKFGDIYINRYKKTSEENQGIFLYVKNIQTNKIWSSNYNNNTQNENYSISFMPDRIKQKMLVDGIKTTMNVTVSSDEPVEIRRLEITNSTNTEQTLEVVSYFEPVLSKKEQDYAHQAFNNLFLVYEYDEQSGALIVKRKKRGATDKEVYLATKLSTNAEQIGETEYEIDKEKFIGRGNLEIPKMIKQSLPFSKNVGLVTEPIAAMKNIVKVLPEQTVFVDLIISVENEKEKCMKNLEKYQISNIERTFEISKARCEAESRYLNVKGTEIELYQKMLSYILFDNPIKSRCLKNVPKEKYSQCELWKYGISGDMPIILVQIKNINDAYVIRQVLKAYEFFRTKNISIELVILNEEKYSYENYVRDEIEKEIANSNMTYLKNIRGGIFLLEQSEIDVKDVNLIKFVSSIVIDSHLGNLKTIIDDLEDDEFGKI
ncbi:MAG: hypothetical protein HFJ48_07490 [Clostridia bacterium]|nr:hypothetical protein [Clostridia bacterium]